MERHFGSVASLGSSGFGGGFVLVLSIAVLVLVLDSILRDPLIESWFRHHDPFEYEYRCTEYEYDCPDESTIPEVAGGAKSKHNDLRKLIAVSLWVG